MMEQQHSAEHVLSAVVPNQFRMATWISNCDAEVMISKTPIVGESGLGSGKHKDPRFTIVAHIVVNECGTRLGPINDNPGENAVFGATLRDRTRTIHEVHRGILIAPNISKCDPTNPSSWHLLEIERPAATRKNLNLISACSDQ